MKPRVSDPLIALQNLKLPYVELINRIYKFNLGRNSTSAFTIRRSDGSRLAGIRN
jgi:hypothetical protein